MGTMHRLWSWLDQRPMRWVGVGAVAFALVASVMGLQAAAGAGAVAAAVCFYWASDRQA